MRENRTSGSEGGEAQTNELSLPLPLSLRRPVTFPVWEDPPWSDQIAARRRLLLFADPWHSRCGRTLRGPNRFTSPTRGIPSVGGLRGPIRFTSPTRGIPSVGGPSVVRSDRRAEAAPTLCRPVAFPVWEDPPWSDQVHFAGPVAFPVWGRLSVIRTGSLRRPVAFPV